MDIDSTGQDIAEDETIDMGHLDDEGDQEDTADVGMTPLADLLNARYGCDNVRAGTSEFSWNGGPNSFVAYRLASSTNSQR